MARKNPEEALTGEEETILEKDLIEEEETILEKDLIEEEETILEKDHIGEEEIIMEKDLTGEEESQPTKKAVDEVSIVILLINLRIRALETVIENHLLKDSSA